MPSIKLVIGLTGGIGSGKSTVAELFAHHNVPIIDTDQISRDLTLPGSPALQQIQEKFGPTVIEHGKLNRKLLRDIIFSDSEKRQWLEELLHPLIREEMRKQVEATTAPYCIVIIPLLFESPPNPIIDRVLVVDVTPEVQIERVAKRDMHSILQVEAIMQAQVTRESRLAGADDIIFNVEGPEYLVPQVEKLHKSYLAIANALKIKG
jgi:dephospho-CoA kinase